MTSPLMLGRTFLPGSTLALVFTLLGLAGGVGLMILTSQSGNPDKIWLAPYCGTAVLCLLGFSLGRRLAHVRAWTVSTLVPGLLPQLIYTALLILALSWLVIIIALVLSEALLGLPILGPMAVASIYLMMGAGVYRRALYALVAICHAPLFLAGTLPTWLAILRHPSANIVSLTILVLTVVTLLRVCNRTPGRDEQHTLHSILSDQHHAATRTLRHRYASWLKVPRMPASRAFLTALEHTRLQAWLNDLASFVAINGGCLLIIWLLSDRTPSAPALMIGVLTAVLAVIIPTMNRGILPQILNQLWLSGSHESRQTLIYGAFLGLLRSSLRLSGLGLLAVLIINTALPQSVAAEPALDRLGLCLLVLAPGVAAALLATGLLLGWQSFSEASGNTLLFSLVLVGELSLGGFIAAYLSTHYTTATAVTLAGLLSASLIGSGAWLSAQRLTRQRSLA